MLTAWSCVENEMTLDTAENSVVGKSLVTKASTDYYCHEASGLLLEEKEDPFMAKRGDFDSTICFKRASYKKTLEI